MRQDFEWIAPADLERSDRGEWWVEGEWLNLDVANRRHARIDTMWHIPGPFVQLNATTSRQTALQAMEHMERTLPDLVRVFGLEPLLPLEVTVLRDEEQYDRFAFGDPDGRRLARHAGRLHSVHSAVFAESWFRPKRGKAEFRGQGVCYWDALIPYGDLYGVHSARLAVGLSYVEALDPSPKAVRKAAAKGVTPEYYADFQSEKRLPAWLRHGAAVYGERFFFDHTTPEDGDAWWARKWSLENLAKGGRLRALEEIMAFPIDPENREDSQKLLIEVGLVVAFMLDGEVPAVKSAHEAFKAAFAAGGLQASHLAALEEALLAHEAELKVFATLPE